MICVICKNGETVMGKTTLTLERDGTILVFKDVPARICENCGEAYVDDETVERLFSTAEQAVCAGVQVEVRQYVAA